MPLFELPAEVGERLDALSEAWNRLRNDVWGRGTTPRAGVPLALANEVADRWTAWRAWYEETRDSMWAALSGGYTAELDAWQRTYAALYAQVKAAGVATPTSPSPIQLPQPPSIPIQIEPPKEPLQVEFAPSARNIIPWVLGLALAGTVIAVVVTTRRRRA